MVARWNKGGLREWEAFLVGHARRCTGLAGNRSSRRSIGACESYGLVAGREMAAHSEAGPQLPALGESHGWIDSRAANSERLRFDRWRFLPRWQVDFVRYLSACRAGRDLHTGLPWTGTKDSHRPRGQQKSGLGQERPRVVLS